MRGRGWEDKRPTDIYIMWFVNKYCSISFALFQEPLEEEQLSLITGNMIKWRGIPQLRVAVMAVDALCLYLFAVDVYYAVYDLKILKTYEEGNYLGSRRNYQGV